MKICCGMKVNRSVQDRQNRSEADHGAHREIDAPHQDDESHAQRQQAGETGLGEQVGQVDIGKEEGREDRRNHDQGQQHEVQAIIRQHLTCLELHTPPDGKKERPAADQPGTLRRIRIA
jgi:hypothetical protein